MSSPTAFRPGGGEAVGLSSRMASGIAAHASTAAAAQGARRQYHADPPRASAMYWSRAIVRSAADQCHPIAQCLHRPFTPGRERDGLDTQRRLDGLESCLLRHVAGLRKERTEPCMHFTCDAAHTSNTSTVVLIRMNTLLFALLQLLVEPSVGGTLSRDTPGLERGQLPGKMNASLVSELRWLPDCFGGLSRGGLAPAGVSLRCVMWSLIVAEIAALVVKCASGPLNAALSLRCFPPRPGHVAESQAWDPIALEIALVPQCLLMIASALPDISVHGHPGRGFSEVLESDQDSDIESATTPSRVWLKPCVAHSRASRSLRSSPAPVQLRSAQIADRSRCVLPAPLSQRRALPGGGPTWRTLPPQPVLLCDRLPHFHPPQNDPVASRGKQQKG